ncbi:hypothetical protein G7046_g9029 [Stylonectria norvegica]|nr:hypothetical protein G7046_g9029 [Stylonectria norvegica]
MMLPKGIVVNSANIYKEVADYARVPPDKVWEYWHVYTTTYKKLKDPTACRLENFWWHVWGSDRQNLKGSTLAKLYEEISLGPTAVPLQGPPNRWEGPDVPPFIRQMMESIQAEGPRIQLPPPESRRSNKPIDPTWKALSSSASKPPPPHPILKKARGPSLSGPRPTARFVSPHESADEGDIPSSGSTAATGSEAPVFVPHSSSKKRSSVASSKKLHAASSTSKRRPVLTKKSSSQSSAGSDVGPRDDSSSVAKRHLGVQHPVSLSAEQIPESLMSTSEDSISSVPQERPVMSEKALGKQPATQRRPNPERRAPSKQENRASAFQAKPPAAERRKPAVLPQSQSLVDLLDHPRRASEASRSTFGIGSLESGSGTLPKMVRSHSQIGYGQPREPTNGRTPSQGLFTGATASTTNIAVQGTILDQSGLGSTPLPSILDANHLAIPIQPSSSSTLGPRLTPTRPTTSASVPLGRTKSQLTLLLERENSRNTSKPRSKN